MRRLSLIHHSAFLILTLTLLPSCGPQPASPTPAPTITQSPNHSITQSPTPTPTPYPLPPYPLPPDLQQPLETLQGWDFTWDPSRGAYIILQRAWDADQAQFNSSTLGEVGYIDREAILHLHSASFTAVPGGKKSAFQSSALHNEIALDLKSLPPVQTAEATSTPENNATERQLGPFTLIETQNPLFAKTGILKVEVNGVTYVYSPQTAITVDVDGRKIVEFYDASLATFSPEQKTIDPSQIPVIDWNALHKGLGPALAIVNGFDRPFSEHLRDTFEGYKIKFRAFPSLQKPGEQVLPAYAQFSYAPLYDNAGNLSYTTLEEPIRYAMNANGEVPLFQTITPEGKRLIGAFLQFYNPSNIATQDKKSRPLDETLIIPAALGEMTDEQIQRFPAFFNAFIRNDTHTRRVFLATQGNFFSRINSPEAARIFASGNDEDSITYDYCRIYLCAFYDQLLGREGIGNLPYRAYKKWGNYHYFDIFNEGFGAIGLKQNDTNSNQKEYQTIYERPIIDVDDNGNEFSVPLEWGLQFHIAGLGF